MIIRRYRVSPMMAVFGKVPRLPGSLMSSDAASSLLQVSSQDEALAMSVQYRAAALKGMAEYDATCAVQSSLYKQSRPRREFEIGDRVCFWRQLTQKQGASRGRQGSYVLGTLMAWSRTPTAAARRTTLGCQRPGG